MRWVLWRVDVRKGAGGGKLEFAVGSAGEGRSPLSRRKRQGGREQAGELSEEKGVSILASLWRPILCGPASSLSRPLLLLTCVHPPSVRSTAGVWGRPSK